MVTETVVAETRRSARRDPGGTGMLKARYGVQLFACWPQRGTFMMQDFHTLQPLPTRVAAERAGRRRSAPRQRAHGDSVSEAVNLLDTSCIAAFGSTHGCSMASLRQVFHSFRPTVAHPSRRETHPTPRGRADESAVGPGQFPGRVASVWLFV